MFGKPTAGHTRLEPTGIRQAQHKGWEKHVGVTCRTGLMLHSECFLWRVGAAHAPAPSLSLLSRCMLQSAAQHYRFKILLVLARMHTSCCTCLPCCAGMCPCLVTWTTTPPTPTRQVHTMPNSLCSSCRHLNQHALGAVWPLVHKPVSDIFHSPNALM